MNDEAAFLAAIRTNPADDTVRLVYADWLEEHADERIVCPVCHNPSHDRDVNAGFCGHCWKSPGSVNLLRDVTRRQRAEFIRVQIELAQLRPPALMHPFQIDFDPPAIEEEFRRPRVKVPRLVMPSTATVSCLISALPRPLGRGDLIDLDFTSITGVNRFEVVGVIVIDARMRPEIDAVEFRVKSGKDHYPHRARLNALRNRERELLDANAHVWLLELPPEHRPILPDAIRQAFGRGFPEPVGDVTAPV